MSIDKCTIQCTHGKGYNCLVCWPSTKRHTLYGRQFVIQAEFADTQEGTKQANVYMELYANVGVLEVSGGRVILASMDDRGVAVTQHPSEVRS